MTTALPASPLQTLGPLSEDAVVIIGAGVAGLGVAWRLASAGRPVVVLERDAIGSGASSAAAGMLAPTAEIEFTDDVFIDFRRESHRRYPAFVAALEADSGLSVDYRDDAERLHRHFKHLRQFGLPVEWLTGAEVRALEPWLAPTITAGVTVPSDHQIDNLKLVEALAAATRRRGGRILTDVRVTGVQVDAGQVTGVVLGQEVVKCQTVVVAAGCWTRQLTGLPPKLTRAIRPIKGQMMSLRMEPEHLLSRVVRAPDYYLVPRRDGRLIIGATSEDVGFDDNLTAGGLFELLRAARETLPMIYELPVHRMWTGLRPASLDNEPVLGHTRVGGLVMATGLYRNGILLTPIVADTVADAVLQGTNAPILAPFSPARFE